MVPKPTPNNYTKVGYQKGLNMKFRKKIFILSNYYSLLKTLINFEIVITKISKHNFKWPKSIYYKYIMQWLKTFKNYLTFRLWLSDHDKGFHDYFRPIFFYSHKSLCNFQIWSSSGIHIYHILHWGWYFLTKPVWFWYLTLLPSSWCLLATLKTKYAWKI